MGLRLVVECDKEELESALTEARAAVDKCKLEILRRMKALVIVYSVIIIGLLLASYFIIPRIGWTIAVAIILVVLILMLATGDIYVSSVDSCDLRYRVNQLEERLELVNKIEAEQSEIINYNLAEILQDWVDRLDWSLYRLKFWDEGYYDLVVPVDEELCLYIPTGMHQSDLSIPKNSPCAECKDLLSCGIDERVEWCTNYKPKTKAQET